jgi:hypothetical protein
MTENRTYPRVGHGFRQARPLDAGATLAAMQGAWAAEQAVCSLGSSRGVALPTAAGRRNTTHARLLGRASSQHFSLCIFLRTQLACCGGQQPRVVSSQQGVLGRIPADWRPMPTTEWVNSRSWNPKQRPRHFSPHGCDRAAFPLYFCQPSPNRLY